MQEGDSQKGEDEILIEDIQNFVEILIHHCLYCRRVYPKSLFQQNTYYGIGVFIVKKSSLSAYINEMV